MTPVGSLWRPSPERIEGANLPRFRRFIEGRGHRPEDGYGPLWTWSVTEQESFWSALWEFCGVVGEPGSRVVEGLDRMPGCRYFPDGRLNFAENLLRRRDEGPAVIAWSEAGERRTLSWADLHRETGRMAESMRSLGLGPGDHVVALLPNIPEALVFLLSAAAVGAVVSTASPDFGVDGVLSRFGPLDPVLFLTVDGYQYGGRVYPVLEKAARIRERLGSVRRTLVVPRVSEDPDLSSFPDGVSWEEFLASGPSAGEVACERLPFDHPLYVLFSSGTTGAPKCMVHGAGGILLQHLKEHQLHCDIHPGDRVFYYTTLGWMMWNWLVTALASEATVLLYDGSPFHPDEEALFDFAEGTGMTLFGTSAKFIDAVRTAGLEPYRTHDLSTVRSILSTGSPLSDDGFRYVYERVKPDVHLASVSGGTDICACFVGGIPTEPVWTGELQGPALATAVDVFDDNGNSMPRGKGELVCTAPIPSMPLRFVGDSDGSRYRAAYFERFPGVWRHGDFIERTGHGGFVIHGRSDATLNVGGVRIGTAEVYPLVESLDEVDEGLLIAQEWKGDTRAVLFVRLAAGSILDPALETRIRSAIRKGASPRHVPAKIVEVEDIPRTRSGKIVELAVREVVHGRPATNLEALANPEVLDEFKNRPELRD
ncbi:MAG: acetoacetate--CoA ligase [Gemmatimonadetes bacterium]|nr:acetoacetate--CoA ligase [Gemmatimonadota bacterium]